MTVTKDRTKAVFALMRNLTKKQVLVGVPAENAQRQPGQDDPQPASNALIGYIMETGSPAQNIPERPHLVPGVKSVEDKVAAMYKAGATAVLNEQTPSLDKTHTAVGLVAEAAVRKKITDGPFTPLAERTLEARRRRGRTGEKPLIDTGQYRRSITHVIREKGK